MLAFLPSGAGKIDFGARQTSASGSTTISAPAPEKPKPMEFTTPLVPRISDVAFGISYFDDVPEPLRAALVASYKDYYEQLTWEAEQRLLKTNSEHPKVLLMRGVNALAKPNREWLGNGIGHLERARFVDALRGARTKTQSREETSKRR
jgi:hypothetical protein